MTEPVIPRLPPFHDMKYVEKNGYLGSQSKSYNDNMWQTLNIIVDYFRNGLLFPVYTDTEITAFKNNDSIPVGTVWYNTTTDKLNLKTAISDPGPAKVEVIQSV